MSEKLTVTALRCPKCKHLVREENYDAHVKSDHKDHIEAEPITATGRGKTKSFTRQIFYMIEDYPLGFAVWSLFLIGATVALMIGRI